MEISKTLFGNVDIDSIVLREGFSETDVGAVVVEPILRKLGFLPENIERNRTLKFRAGHKQHSIKPDYLIRIGNSYAWALEIKSPNQNLFDAENIEQAYSYAANINVQSNYFALCNGREFVCYKTTETNTPRLHFKINEIDKYWDELQKILSINSFQTGNTFTYETVKTVEQPETIEYMKRPLLAEIAVKKRATKRHFGVHGYFTRQSWDIVSAYIKHFSNTGDVVLDPFGGSGVTAVEAVLNGRQAINADINPMAVFIVQSLLMPVNFSRLDEAYNRVRDSYIKNEPKNKKEIEEILQKYPGPKELALPKGSDVETVPKLFSREQLAQLALLKGLIKKEKDKNVHDTLMLVFSGMVTKTNLTYHTATAQRGNNIVSGDASPFRYYRYRIAPIPRKPELLKYLDIRYKKVKAAKEEIKTAYSLNTHKEFETIFENVKNLKGTATDLSFLASKSVDYIYTDPPYGKKIPYLDLSAMWFAWLDMNITENDYELEVIEGGSREKSKDEYKRLIAKSIKEMYRVLKFDRWLSFVFAHKDPDFWHLVIDSCEEYGFEYVGAVPQKNGQTSFKKRQHPFTVLSGQLILNFRKTKNPKALLRANLGADVDDIFMETIEGVIAKNHGATLEQINDELIVKGLENGFLHLLKKHYSNLTPILLDRFDYNSDTERFNIKKNKPFTTLVDEKLRIKYFITSFLFATGTADFDKIVYEIMPLLRNGRTPENQTILSVLEDIGVKTDGGWKLKPKETMLFD
ncbi:MAG: type I restriction enzyme HsdR N-terminal domain-containing protein [Spirochaetaceae bacterium]|jgi:tRNA G10  N-methylase Trm11|nr:type I restriction enzyme HsdR N-terminal domain-containing protein [Spirochaetaceae bacterium]